MMAPILMNFDDRAPEVIAYWAKHGMVKECHGDDQPMSWTEYAAKTGYLWEDPGKQGRQNLWKKWNAFVPCSAFKDENKGRKYPLVIALHGGFNPMSIIDGWGYVHEAAKREWIVIAPSIELDDILDEIIEQAISLYPVDTRRIYATGFSYGGFMSNLLGCKCPDVYAAVGPCGFPVGDCYSQQAIGPEPQLPFDGVSRAKAMGVYMPMITISGNLDGNRFPLYDFRAPERTGPASFRNLNAQSLLEGINYWARVNDAQEVAMEDVMQIKGRPEASLEEKRIGLPLSKENRQTLVSDGLTYHIGDLRSKDGVVRTRLVVAMNMPHWPTPEFSRLIFSFFSQFSRDPDSKESIHHPAE